MENDKKRANCLNDLCSLRMAIEMVVKELPTVKKLLWNLATEKLTVFPKEGFGKASLRGCERLGYQAAEKRTKSSLIMQNMAQKRKKM